MTSETDGTRPAKLFSVLAAACLGTFMLACGLVPAQQPVATTLPPPTTSQSTAVVILPTDTLGAPPAPDFPQVVRGGPNGDNQDKFRAMLDFSPSYFLRMYVFYSQNPGQQFNASKDGHGIQSVEFAVTSPDGGKKYYDHTEKKPAYCLFGSSGQDCNPWTMENGRYVWKQGGEAVRSGKYGLAITVIADNGDTGTWLWNKQEGNPIVITVP